MNNTYIKMNNNDNQLSLGNMFNIIKNKSKNKTGAIQTEIFCVLMDICDIAESTVNNYCTGYRSINSVYKQKYIYYQKKFKDDKDILIPVVNGILSIVDGIRYEYKSVKEINNNESLEKIINDMHMLAKNDIYVSNNLRKEVLNYIEKKEYYMAFSLMLFFIIIDKKQPLYEEDTIKETILDIVKNTNLGINDLKSFLDVQFTEGISLISSLKKLASQRNPYALYELGNMEYNGIVMGKPRYEEAYDYHLLAAELGHPTSNWMIAHMIINKKIGNLNDDELKLAWSYLKKAIELDSVSALNTLGICYLRGYNTDCDVDKAIYYFEQASKKGYIYAYNNLGNIYEKEENYELAFKYYLKSADDGESWACNKIGNFYMNGIYVEKDPHLAFEYYLKGANAPIKNRYNYNIINLVKYYYLNGNAALGISKNIDAAISLLEPILDYENACELLVFCFYEKYLEDGTCLDKLNYYLDYINHSIYYDKERKEEILDKLKNLDYVIKKASD